MSSVSSVSSVSSIDADLSVSSVSDIEDDINDEPAEPIKKRAPRIVHDRTNPFDTYSEQEFKKIFGFSKYAVLQIKAPIEKYFAPFSLKNNPISSMNQLLMALRFFTSRSYQMTIADIFLVSRSTICRIVRRISESIVTLADEYIKMPKDKDEIRKVCEEFQEISGFPNVLGIIDCLHVKILPQPGPKIYANANGWPSVNVQLICDANLRIRDVEVLNPGSFHNNNIFNTSSIKRRLENKTFGETYLLGDNSYQCQQYLLTPILKPKSPEEFKYNEAHEKTRTRIEMTFELLLSRFACLSSQLRLSLQKISTLIVAICVLHNFCLDLYETVDYLCDESTVYDEQPKKQTLEDNEKLLDVRNKVLREYFSN